MKLRILAMGIILLLMSTGTAAATDYETGDVVANYSFNSEVISVATASDAVYLTGVDYTNGVYELIKLDPDTYQKEWSVNGLDWSDDVIVGENEEYVYYADSTHIYKVKTADGSIVFNKSVGDALDLELIPNTDKFMSMGFNGLVRIHDSSTGEVLENHTFSDVGGSRDTEEKAIKVSEDGSVGYIAGMNTSSATSGDAVLKSFSISDFSLRWTKSSDIDGQISPLEIESKNGFVYIGVAGSDYTGVKKLYSENGSVEEGYQFYSSNQDVAGVEITDSAIAIATDSTAGGTSLSALNVLDRDSGDILMNYTGHSDYYYDFEFGYSANYLYTATYDTDSRKIVSPLYTASDDSTSDSTDDVSWWDYASSDDEDDSEETGNNDNNGNDGNDTGGGIIAGFIGYVNFLGDTISGLIQML